MLRFIWNEGKRNDVGLIKACNEAIEAYCRSLRAVAGKQSKSGPGRHYRLELMAQGFIRSLDELEQSIYGSRRFGEDIVQKSAAQLSAAQMDDYHRHLYFYKNALIRLFSVLDKLGYFINDSFQVRTEKLKPKFSYYTVLRQMHKEGIHAPLEKDLYAIKLQWQKTMQRLRKKRNVEIHHINVEVIDDLQFMEREYLEHQRIENLAANQADLEDGFEMVCRSLFNVFRYAKRQLDR